MMGIPSSETRDFLLGSWHSYPRAVDVKNAASSTESRAFVNFAHDRYNAINPVVDRRDTKYYPAPLPSVFDARDHLDWIVGNMEYQSMSGLSEHSFWNIIASEFMRHGRRFDATTNEVQSMMNNSNTVQSRTRDLGEITRVPGGIAIAIMQRKLPREVLDRLWNTRDLADALVNIKNENVLDHFSMRLIDMTGNELNPHEINWNVENKFLATRNKVITLYTMKNVLKSLDYRLDALKKKIKRDPLEKSARTVQEQLEADKWMEPVQDAITATIKRKTEFIKDVRQDRNPAVREAVLDIIDEERLNKIADVKAQGGYVPKEMIHVPYHDIVLGERTGDTCTFLEHAAGRGDVTSKDPWVDRNKKRATEMIQFYRPCRERHEERKRKRS